MRRWTIAVGVFGLGIAAGILTLGAARDYPGYWFAGSSDRAGAAFLAAGWSLVACGLAAWLRRPSSRCGLLLSAAGFAWFAPEWNNNPKIGSSVAFTIGLLLGAACPALVAHAVLAYPGGRLRSRTVAGAIAAAYAGGVVLLGVLPTLLFDPKATGCSACPDNVLLLTGREEFEDLTRAGVYAGVGWAAALAALGMLRFARGSRGNRPVVGAGVVYLVLVAATFAVSLDRGLVTNGTVERRLWFGQAASLVAVAATVGWSLARARRARSSIARLVVELTQSPPPGGLKHALARIAGDPGLALAYPLGDGSRIVDAEGRGVELPPGSETTSLVQDGRTVAVLAHRPGVLDDEQLVDEVAAAARLALENERLHAEVKARLEELRSSRARIVEAGDVERKRLERDLHDGAQQRLVGLALSLRLLRSRIPDADGQLERAEEELRRAAAELRELAHGIFPAVLADEGLGPAVEALAEEGHVHIRISGIPDRRYDAAVETAAYTVVAETVRAATDTVDVGVTASAGTLVVEVATRNGAALDLTALDDRIGALDGRLIVSPGAGGGTTIRAELPCAS